MNRNHFEPQQSSSFTGGSEPPSFHNNLHYQEVLAALRYGMIARKGLILLIGDPGTGKTTLLHQLTRELAANVTCIFESDPEVNFTDLLRLVLANLEFTDDAGGGLSMMQRCKTLLRAQSERGQIISLVIDNAQLLRDETLEYLLHNFFGVSLADRDENLLQIVLAGPPQLQERLAQPRLRGLKPRSELVCQLQPLSEKDIAAYIDHRLQACQLPPGMFDRAAINRIIAHTGGNPQRVNALCDRAVQLAGGSPGRQIAPEIIVRAARDLELSEARRPAPKIVMPDPNLEIDNEREEPFRLADSDTTEVVGQTFLNYTFDDRRPRFWSVGGERKAVPVFLLLLLLGGTIAWLNSEPGKIPLARWAEQLGVITGSPQPVPAPPKPSIESSSEMPRNLKPSAPTQSSEIPSPANNDFGMSNPAPPETETVEPPSPFLAEKTEEKPKSPAIDPKPAPRQAPAPAPNDRRAPLAEKADAQRRILEAQIYRAIENRAIIGVTVSVIDNVTYLDGRVATVRQRNAAERAARSVAGVERVRNRIVVGS